MITLNCLKLVVRLKAERFLCTSSQAEYGETTEMITNDTVTNPVTSYGEAKVSTYCLVRDLAKRLDILFIWARVFLVYGEYDNPNSLIPQLLKLLRNCSKITFNIACLFLR
ncbi:MAG: NAD-dependent epimerase/dehydratase family protein [Lachnospiraceae bacterium]|nr:NAD-dependent epimerase/dehydratase family protein [Lachnospiraceae bacterium]